MSAKVPWKIEVVDHPGSTAEEIANEPDWDAVHPHRIGFKNGDRFVGISADGADDYAAEIEEARKIQDELKKGIAAGKLVNFRDLVTHQKVRFNDHGIGGLKGASRPPHSGDISFC